MTNETKTGAVDLREARSVIWQASGLAVIRDAIREADQGKPETWAKISPAEAAYVRDGLFMAQRLLDALAAQSQPAATVQELADLIRTRLLGVRPEDQDIDLEDDDWRTILAALTAEPAAKAGDAVTAMGLKAAYQAWQTKRGLRPFVASDESFEAGWIAALDAHPPSPQPDMGSGKARTRVAEAVGRVLGIDIHERCPSEDSEGDLGCDSSTCPGALTEDHDTEEHRERIYRMADAAISALSPPASQSVDKVREAVHLAIDRWMPANAGEKRKMRLYVDILAALSTLPHKEEATPATTERGGDERLYL